MIFPVFFHTFRAPAGVGSVSQRFAADLRPGASGAPIVLDVPRLQPMGASGGASVQENCRWILRGFGVLLLGGTSLAEGKFKACV